MCPGYGCSALIGCCVRNRTKVGNGQVCVYGFDAQTIKSQVLEALFDFDCGALVRSSVTYSFREQIDDGHAGYNQSHSQ